MAKTYEDGAHRETFEGEDRMVAVKTVGYTGWKIVSVMPMEKFLGDFSRTRTMAVMIIIVAILVMIFANQFVAVRVAKPLRNLEDSLTGIGMDREPQDVYKRQVFISHKMAELRQISDDITIMRDGCYVGTWEMKNISDDEIVKQMVGRDLTNIYPPLENEPGDVLLEVNNFKMCIRDSHI